MYKSLNGKNLTSLEGEIEEVFSRKAGIKYKKPIPGELIVHIMARVWGCLPEQVRNANYEDVEIGYFIHQMFLEKENQANGGN